MHDPASDLTITLGFKDTITMKAWLATLALLFACRAARPGDVAVRPAAARKAPRVARHPAPSSGRVAFLLRLPVADHCLYPLAFQA